MHSCARLAYILELFNRLQGPPMELGTPSRVLRRNLFSFVLLLMVGAAMAQQPAMEPVTGSPGSSTQPSSPLNAAPSSLSPANLTPVLPISQAAANAVPENKSQNPADEPMVARFGPGDLLELNVYNVPELATKARVSNAGDVYLPLIDYVHVEGLTQEEAQALIEKRLTDGGFVRNPHVTIFVDEASSQGITLLGEVSKPGIYPEIGDHKLYTIISEAGGFTPSASRKVAIIRQGKPEPMHIDLPRNLADDLSGNVDILPGDTINVPRAPIIYVVGDVGRPAGLLIDNGTLTVLQALALAGGANRTAKMGGVRIIHKTPSGMTETRVELKKMLEAKTPDITLQADDILFVPVSGAKLAAARTAEAAVSAATAISIYAVHP